MRRVFLPRFLVTCFVLSCLGVSAASAAVKDRISVAVSSTGKVAIPNSVHGKVRLAADLGPVAANTRLAAMTLRFSRTDAQQAALDQLLLDQQNPASPRYHQWLTPAQYAAQFGVSSADIAKVTTWLTGQGFTITEVANSGTFVRFDGTAGQAQAAFSTSIHSLSIDGETHFANITDPSVPGALASVVTGITGLHNFKLRSRLRSSVVPASMARPEFTSSISGTHYVAPGDFYTIYDVSALFNSGITGAGVPVAVMGQVDINMEDIAAFRTAAGLTANLPTVHLYGTDPGAPICSQNCTPNVGDLDESSLDVEWAGAVAPSASIIFVNSTDVLETSLTDAIDNNLAPIMTVSYGGCEASIGLTEANVFNSLFQQANAQGITVIGPAGDDGATDCDNAVTTATHGLAVDFPASSPFVTGMGGTMFSEAGGTYWSTNNGTNSSSVTTYIPENVWNEDTTGATFSATGGGVSKFFTKPSWQLGTGVPSDGFRDVPDIALNSAASHDGYLYCVNGSCTNGGFRASDGQSLTVAGGTSFASPSFAGILALIEQKISSRVGNANPTIYSLANSTFYNNIFHDVTSGNNNSLCATGTANCPSGGTIGYAAGVGYDQATGWGSVDVANLANHWPAVTTPVPIQGPVADFTLTPSTTSVTIASVSQSGVATFTVTPVNGFTGTVTFSVKSASSTSVTPTLSFSPTSVTTSGTTTLTISFPNASLRTASGNSSLAASAPGESPARKPWYLAGSGLMMSCVFIFALPRRKRLGTLLVALLSIALMAGAVGCSSGNTTIATVGSKTPSAVGSYTVVVTAVASGSTGASSHSATVNLVVQ